MASSVEVDVADGLRRPSLHVVLHEREARRRLEAGEADAANVGEAGFAEPGGVFGLAVVAACPLERGADAI